MTTASQSPPLMLPRLLETWLASVQPPLATMLVVADRPVVVGRYGAELTTQLLRYTTDSTWQPLPVRLLEGRSDFALLAGVPSQLWTR